MRFLGFIILFSSFSSIYGQLTVEKIWKEYQFFGKSVGGFSAMADGEHYTKFATIDNKQVIGKYALSQQEETGKILVDLDNLQYNGSMVDVDDYTFNADETKMLLSSGTKPIYRRSYTTNYYVYDLATKKLAPLDTEHAPQTLAEYSPDGTKVSYIHANNIYVKDLQSGKVTQLTHDGMKNAIINGTTDWVYEEEFAITKAYGWSPDSKSIAYLKFNECKVQEFTMTYYGKLYPDLYTFKYPKAGEDNSKVTAWITNVVKPKPQTVELGSYEYIPRLKWSQTSNTLILLTLNRHQNKVQYHKVDWNGKLATSQKFFEETDEAYVEIDDNLLILSDGQTILRTSERDGHNHIYQVGFDGALKQLSQGDWDVIEFYGVDDEFIYFSAAIQGAIHKGVYRVNMKSLQREALTEEIGQHSAEFTQGMKYFLHTFSNANTPPQFDLCTNTGETLFTLENNLELRNELETYQLSPKEFTQFELAGRTLNGWMIKPHDFDPAKKYPVYINIYGGPGSNMVDDGWDGANYMYHQLLAQEGYIVVSVDPRGTMYRGAKFKKSTYLQLGKLETEDFIDVAKLLGTYNYVDAGRIGIQGWSYGGFMTSLCMTKGADVFKMGIAVAPVTNWRYYDNIYTERFMRTPAENANGYDDNSPINHVSKLTGKYLLIHGSGDDNVHYQNTMEMITALVKANKQFDHFIYPNKNHGIYGGNTRNHLFNMMLNYTKENL